MLMYYKSFTPKREGVVNEILLPFSNKNYNDTVCEKIVFRFLKV